MKNLIFLTMARMMDISRRGIYTDLIRKFQKEGWNVYIVTPNERREGRLTELVEKEGIHILAVQTLNLQKTNVLEKGVGQILVENHYKRAIKKYLNNIQFDLILYSTPPITFPKVIVYLKKHNPKSKTYLLLKDIFPQNAVDLGMMSRKGIKGILYRFFRNKEKKLYSLSDYIGCMSPANVEYVLKHNPEIAHDRVEVAPNSFELVSPVYTGNLNRKAARRKFHLPVDKPVFIYGGNLGKPQGIPFLIQCLEANSTRKDCYFVIIGNGTELSRLRVWYEEKHPKNVTVMKGLPKNEYDELVRACDVGMIFLDHRFTIPNYPSRILSYLENKMPVLCATDINTDIGRIADENGYGYWCESNSIAAFSDILEKMINSDRKAMGEKGYRFMCDKYLIDNTYNAIVKHV
ncbi:glycosyltransferase family 4 protein [Bacteroides zoogleoformans]|mgnify:CR=1 FL=1|uniref:glycosyltransferase family 4 protein n=1 Tax=Bacteroides zoogleoformans TaxID=28119 RepID=UPI00248E0034|nr:glycosyltransferase family 4 protein [Bacteroides zoogleoformans]